MDTKVLKICYWTKRRGSSLEKFPQGRYTREFPEEAARLVIENGMSVGEVTARFYLSMSTLENRVKSATLGDIGKNRHPLKEVEAELAKVKRELAITMMERNILKKVAA
jgi:transposase